MSPAAHLAARLLRIALVAPALARLRRHALRVAAGIGLVVALGGAGMAFLLIALRYRLEREIGPLWTPVAIGGVLCLGALAAYFALLRPRGRATTARDAEAAGLPPELAEPMRSLEAKIASNPLPSVAIALAAGFAAAALLRSTRRRPNPASNRPAAAGRAADTAAPAAEAAGSAWMHDAPRREAGRRRTNGRGA